jgi:hypothetical protein
MIEFMNAIRWEVVGFTLVMMGGLALVYGIRTASKAGKRQSDQNYDLEKIRMEAKNSTTRLTHSPKEETPDY